MENLPRFRYGFKSELLTYSNCKIYRDEEDKAILAEVKISDLAYNDIGLFEDSDLSHIYYAQLSLVLNTILVHKKNS